MEVSELRFAIHKLEGGHLQSQESAVSVNDQVHPDLCATWSEAYQECYFPQLSFVHYSARMISTDKDSSEFLHLIWSGLVA